ncbi:hypothetical protein CQW23_24726 [Capsicum baccatum]|uniref:Uncharacterized protein n=1 Tax=Capsicum baccatum TaxID=33114 RepID=A0A2G2VVM5_CAPBA|nr:hypothetical protein CQW23_24726 [Capsicum baccatum]
MVDHIPVFNLVILGLAAGLASLPIHLECSLPAEDRNVSNSVLHTGEMKAEFVQILPHVQSFLAVSPEIFIINATFILLIHGVVFSTSKKYDYPPLFSNVGWVGLHSVARLGGQRALGCGGAIIIQLPNLKRHRIWTAGNRSMGGHLILLPTQGWLIVRSRLEYPWFWKAHESECNVECAIETTLRRYLYSSLPSATDLLPLLLQELLDIDLRDTRLGARGRDAAIDGLVLPLDLRIMEDVIEICT